MKITAKIIADSVNPDGERITTFVLHYPYWIHGEVMTHRRMRYTTEEWSLNAASTRAIPIKTYVQKVLAEMSIPLVWTKNEKGMHTDKLVEEALYETLEQMWRLQGIDATKAALKLEEMGLHKQVANRLLMPFMMMDTLVTATEYQNFFNLRDHPHAEPHIQILAREMKKAYAESTPKKLHWGEWHIPYAGDYVLEYEGEEMITRPPLSGQLIKSVAACARVSMANVDGSKATPEKDLHRFTELKDANPIHASPFEHCAKAFDWKGAIAGIIEDNKGVEMNQILIDDAYRSMGNFRGFQQLRWFVENNLPY